MNITKLRKIILEELSLGGSGRSYHRPRKLGLVDYLGESSDHHLLELDDDSIISTGARLSKIEEAPTDDQIKARAGQVWQRKGSPKDQPPDQVQADYFTAKSELEDEEELVDTRNASSPTSPENEEGMQAFQAQRAAVEPTPAPPGTPDPIPAGIPDTTSVAPPAPATATPTPALSTDADDAGRFPAVDPTDSDSMGSDVDVDNASELASDPDIDASSDGLGDSIINRLIAGAGEEDARRSSATGTGTGTVSPPPTPLPEPPLPPSGEETDVTSPGATTNITDKKALSRYLDQVALGSVRISLDESRRFKQKFRG
jgi:hypothetical protein